MANKKYAQKDLEFIVGKYKAGDYAAIRKKYKVKTANIRTLISNLRRNGWDIPYHNQLNKTAREGYKICNNCEDELELEKNFHNLARSKDGKNGMCKKCVSDYYKKFFKKNKNFKHRSKLADGRVNKIKGEVPKKVKKIELVSSRLLTDESKMPEGAYEGCKMQDVPAKHLLYMYEKSYCNPYVKRYVEDNMETIKQEVKK